MFSLVLSLCLISSAGEQCKELPAAQNLPESVCLQRLDAIMEDIKTSEWADEGWVVSCEKENTI